MRGSIRVAVVAVALVASAAVAGSAAQASTGPPVPGKPLPTAADKGPGKPEYGKPADKGPGEPDHGKLSDEQLKKLKHREVTARRGGKHRIDDAKLAELARNLGVSKSHLVKALTAVKLATIKAGSPQGPQLTPTIVRKFACDLGITQAQAKKVLEYVFTSPDKGAPDKGAPEKPKA